MKTIYRGAEAILYIEKHDGKDILVKERIKKGYRISELDDKIRRQRTKREEKLLNKARFSGVTVPKVIGSEDSKILMEFVEGKKLKDVLNGLPEKKRKDVYEKIGKIVGLLHQNGIVHGDLTTSNFILTEDSKLFIVDFGLGKHSVKAEDFAVDLYVLYEALKSVHFKYLNEGWQYILKTYMYSYSNAKAVLNRIEKIKTRRRYK